MVQEAFVELLRCRRTPERIVAWLYGTVRRLALCSARTARRRQQREHRAAAMRQAWIAPIETGDQIGLDVARLMRSVDQLPPELREAVVARIWSGLSFEEIGCLAGVSSSTAHRRYCRALRALRAAMNGRLLTDEAEP